MALHQGVCISALRRAPRDGLFRGTPTRFMSNVVNPGRRIFISAANMSRNISCAQRPPRVSSAYVPRRDQAGGISPTGVVRYSSIGLRIYFYI